MSVYEILRIQPQNRADLIAQLDRAEEHLRLRAIELGTGILVTRHSAWDFTVELDDRVPFGTTLERSLW